MLQNKESITAKICAFARAYHSYFENEKIYDDYLAFDLLGYEEYEDIKHLLVNKLLNKNQVDNSNEFKKLLNENIFPIPIGRIKYAEEKLIEFSDKNEECQYVICGAGFDTFAFRNTNKNIKIFELDHPNTQNYKKHRIKELKWVIPENLNFVPINFESQRIEERLLDVGFNPNIKTYFAILGVSYYLNLETLSKTFESISKISSKGSLVVFDYPDDKNWNVKRVSNLRKMTASLGETMEDGFSYKELEIQLKKCNFKIIEYKNPQKIQDEFFRGRKDNLNAYENVHFILAEYL